MAAAGARAALASGGRPALLLGRAGLSLLLALRRLTLRLLPGLLLLGRTALPLLELATPDLATLDLALAIVADHP